MHRGRVAETMPDPIGTEFGIVVDLVTYGDEITTAMPTPGGRRAIAVLVALLFVLGFLPHLFSVAFTGATRGIFFLP